MFIEVIKWFFVEFLEVECVEDKLGVLNFRIIT